MSLLTNGLSLGAIGLASVSTANATTLAAHTHPQYSCNTNGYPAYVINAACAEHVQLGGVFAALYNIRLIVKETGHDYMGCSSAPKALSIWTYNLKGFTFYNSFKLADCSATIDTAVVTVAAGHDMLELYAATDAANRTVVGGEAEDVGIGRYLTG